ncbi:MAG: hypothetical protein GXY76_10740 [Chloroflexi bacterium]|nr:hypothetical protein [Chloroflexota bacterium]
MRVPQREKLRGSQKCLQILVNDYPSLINTQLAFWIGLPSAEGIHWRSPLKQDEYAEYRDSDAIDHLGMSLPKRSLESFWPRQGPQWDALAKTDRGDVILVEAKAHIREMVTDPCKAKSTRSQDVIRESLDATKRFLGANPDVDWMKSFYQYTNRLAHLYLLRELNSLPAYLLLVYFINDQDVGGPGSEQQWQGAIQLRDSYLRIPPKHRLSEYILHAFVDVGNLGSA